MKIILPTLTSQRIAFSQNFHNLNYVYGMNGIVSGVVSVDKGLDVSGGGYVAFGGYGAGVAWNLPYWSIFIKAVVPAAGSARALLSCGHGGTDRFEIGIDSSNHMQLIGGSTVVSDDVLTAGSHNLLWIYNGSDIEFWVDGVRIGTETVSLGTGTLPYIYVGVASDGSSRKWGGVINNLDIYTYPADENEAFLISGIEGWTPRNLLSTYGGSYSNGMYWDGDDDGSYELNTQPAETVMDTFGAGWTGTNPFDHSAGTASILAKLTPYLIVGNRYKWTFDINSISGGSLTPYTGGTGAGVARSLPGSYVEENTCLTNGTWGMYAAAATVCNITMPSKVDINLSCKTLYPYTSGTLSGSKFSQATAASMPWKDADNFGLKFDGVADYMLSDTSADVMNFLTSPNGCTIAFVIKKASTLGTQYLLSTYNGAASGVGLRVDGDTAHLLLTTGVGIVQNTYIADATLTAGQHSCVITLDSEADTNSTIVMVDDVLQARSVSLAGRILNTGTQLNLGRRASAYYSEGSISKLFIVNSPMTPTDRLKLSNYLTRSIR